MEDLSDIISLSFTSGILNTCRYNVKQKSNAPADTPVLLHCSAHKDSTWQGISLYDNSPWLTSWNLDKPSQAGKINVTGFAGDHRQHIWSLFGDSLAWKWGYGPVIFLVPGEGSGYYIHFHYSRRWHPRTVGRVVKIRSTLTWTTRGREQHQGVWWNLRLGNDLTTQEPLFIWGKLTGHARSCRDRRCFKFTPGTSQQCVTLGHPSAPLCRWELSTTSAAAVNSAIETNNKTIKK